MIADVGYGLFAPPRAIGVAASFGGQCTPTLHPGRCGALVNEGSCSLTGRTPRVGTPGADEVFYGGTQAALGIHQAPVSPHEQAIDYCS